MIHFDFVVEDVDAEIIMSFFDDAIARAITKMHQPETPQHDIDWFKKHIEYLKELRGKMKNKWVESEAIQKVGEEILQMEADEFDEALKEHEDGSLSKAFQDAWKDGDLWDGDPDCDHEIEDKWSGVKCKKCGAWFCY